MFAVIAVHAHAASSPPDARGDGASVVMPLSREIGPARAREILGIRGRRSLDQDDAELITQVVHAQSLLVAESRAELRDPAARAAQAMRANDVESLSREMNELFRIRRMHEERMTAIEGRLFGRLLDSHSLAPEIVDELRRERSLERDQELPFHNWEAAVHPASVLVAMQREGLVTVAPESRGAITELVLEHDRERADLSRNRIERVLASWTFVGDSPAELRSLSLLRAVCTAEDRLVALNRKLVDKVCEQLVPESALSFRQRYEDLASPRIARDPLGLDALIESAASRLPADAVAQRTELGRIEAAYAEAIRPIVDDLRNEMFSEVREFSRRMSIEERSAARREDRRRRLAHRLLDEALRASQASSAVVAGPSEATDPTAPWRSLIRERASAIAELRAHGPLPRSLRFETRDVLPG